MKAFNNIYKVAVNLLKITCVGLFLLVCQNLTAQTKVTARQIPEKTRILFVLDGSGSMLAPWEGNSRINIAKKVMSKMIDSLAQVKNVQVGLRVYGHQFDKKHQNCGDTKLEVGFGDQNHEKIKAQLINIKPKGVTPISKTLEKAAGDFSNDPAYRNVIIMITDGLESCDGDPCAVSKALQRKRVFLQPFIIGIGMTRSDASEFDCMGTFYNAQSVNQFDKILHGIVKRSLTPTKVRVDLLDIRNNATETNVNMSFINALTGDTEYDFIHYIDKNGTPDVFQVDPVIKYDLVIHTTPKVIKKDIKLTDPKLNIIKVKTPQGSLVVSLNNYQEYKDLQAIVKRKGSDEILHHFKINEEINLLVGRYEVEILTTPRKKVNVEISQSKREKITLETPGILNITDNFAGYGGIYEIDKNGFSTWVKNLNEKSVRTSIAMQPGQYKVVVRSKNAYGVEYTITKEFTIKPGLSTNVNLL